MSANLYKRFGGTDAKSREGVWIDVEGSEFKVSRASGVANPRYQAALDEQQRKYRRKLDAGLLGTQKQQEIYTKVFVDTILLDWRGVKSKTGEDVPFSKEAAIKLFTELPELLDYLSKEASDRSNFEAAIEEEELGNSDAT